MKGNRMNYRMFSVAALAVAMFASSPAWAAKDVKAARDVRHDGKFVSVTGDQLVMANKNGKEHSHTLAADAKVTCDGIACKAADLKAGMKIRVTTKKDDKKVATQVEALDKNTLFADTHDGKFISITDNKLVMTNSKGKEHSHTLAADATMTCDGMVCKAEQLKAGMKIRVTTEKGEAGLATHVEALDKDAEFTLGN